MSNVLTARRIKADFSAKYGSEPWFAGVASTREDGHGFIVRVLVKPGAPRPTLPAEVDGITIQVVDAAP